MYKVLTATFSVQPSRQTAFAPDLLPVLSARQVLC